MTHCNEQYHFSSSCLEFLHLGKMFSHSVLLKIFLVFFLWAIKLLNLKRELAMFCNVLFQILDYTKNINFFFFLIVLIIFTDVKT